MPTEQQHTRAADGHLDAVGRALAQDPDWAAVMLFYAGLHRLEAAFAVHNIHKRTHVKRDEFLRRHCRQVMKPYMRLKNESLKARYLQGGLFSLDSSAVKSQLRDDKYEKVVAAAEDFRKNGPRKKKI